MKKSCRAFLFLSPILTIYRFTASNIERYKFAKRHSILGNGHSTVDKNFICKGTSASCCQIGIEMPFRLRKYVAKIHHDKFHHGTVVVGQLAERLVPLLEVHSSNPIIVKFL